MCPPCVRRHWGGPFSLRFWSYRRRRRLVIVSRSLFQSTRVTYAILRDDEPAVTWSTTTWAFWHRAVTAWRRLPSERLSATWRDARVCRCRFRTRDGHLVPPRPPSRRGTNYAFLARFVKCSVCLFHNNYQFRHCGCQFDFNVLVYVGIRWKLTYKWYNNYQANRLLISQY